MVSVDVSHLIGYPQAIPTYIQLPGPVYYLLSKATSYVLYICKLLSFLRALWRRFLLHYWDDGLRRELPLQPHKTYLLSRCKPRDDCATASIRQLLRKCWRPGAQAYAAPLVGRLLRLSESSRCLLRRSRKVSWFQRSSQDFRKTHRSWPIKNSLYSSILCASRAGLVDWLLECLSVVASWLSPIDLASRLSKMLLNRSILYTRRAISYQWLTLRVSIRV